MRFYVVCKDESEALRVEAEIRLFYKPKRGTPHRSPKNYLGATVKIGRENRSVVLFCGSRASQVNTRNTVTRYLKQKGYNLKYTLMEKRS